MVAAWETSAMKMTHQEQVDSKYSKYAAVVVSHNNNVDCREKLSC